MKVIQRIDALVLIAERRIIKMKINKVLVTLVCVVLVSFCFGSMDVVAANILDNGVKNELEEEPLNSKGGISIEYTSCLAECENVSSNSTKPVCDHSDPASSLNPHSTMRYLRTVEWFNPIEMRYDIRDWYQCEICRFERFWVHGYHY